MKHIYYNKQLFIMKWAVLSWSVQYNKEFLGGFWTRGNLVNMICSFTCECKVILDSLDWTKNVSMDEEWCGTKGKKWKENHSR